GELPQKERERLETLLMASPRQRQDLEFTRDLIEDLTAASRQSDRERGDFISKEMGASDLPGARPVPWWKSILDSLHSRGPMRIAYLVTSGLMAALFVSTLIWSLVLQNRIERLEAERATLEKKERDLRQQIDDRSDYNEKLAEELESERNRRAEVEQELAGLKSSATPPTPESTASFLLRIDAISRGISDSNIVNLPKGARRLRLQIELDEKDKYRRYGGAIKTFEGEEIWREDVLRAERTASGDLVLTLPTSLFAVRDYTLTLKGENERGDWVEVRDYSFRIRK
ncbi:MAG: DUF3450 domain-containing protein, partial [Blastocatellia bacterium]|nr:DUF3450 domain-containing protein [Blastocatellia bacterium]